MTSRLVSLGRWMLRRPLHWIAPITGAVFLVTWIVGEAGRGPWPALLAFIIPAAVMVGISPWMPTAALAVMVVLPVLQLVGLIEGPGSTTWPIHVAIPLTGFVLGASASGRVRRWVPVAGVAAMLVVAFLVAAPSSRGSWVSWVASTPSGGSGIQVTTPNEQAFVVLGLGGILLYLAAWGIGVLYRMGVTGRLSALAALLSEHPDEESTLAPHTTIAGLTSRELEIYALVARGLSNAEIAAHEHIAEATVKTHVSSILRKLELRSRTQLAARARDRELESA